MGKPSAFDEANTTLLPPPGRESDVLPLPIRRLDGQLVSCWEVTPEEVDEIQRTGKVWLSIWGGVTHPPVYVTGLKQEVV